MSPTEARAIFEIAHALGDTDWKRARHAVKEVSDRERDRKTIRGALGVARELMAAGDLTWPSDDKEAMDIADRAGYGVSRQTVQRLAGYFGEWQQARALTPFHAELIRDLLESACDDVERYRGPFPKVWSFSYARADPSQGLRYSEASGSRVVEWDLDTEKEPGWDLALSHLETGEPNAYEALKTVKREWGPYWDDLWVIESGLRAQASEYLKDTQGTVRLDDGRYFRTILAEVDREPSEPSRSAYTVVPGVLGVLVRYDGSGIVAATDAASAEAWVARHLDWRREFLSKHRPGLEERRDAVRAEAEVFSQALRRAHVAGKMPGGCEVCGARETVSEPQVAAQR